ncbi:MAG: cell division protein ZapA [Bacteroidetes bacterium]|nr:cell division protein ZapA [Bacteroidota bacterium]
MEEKDDTVSMNVMIAERVYPLRVMLGDEEKVKNAVKLVNDNIKEYQRQYEGKDKQDYMAMCLLNLATEKVKLLTDVQNSRSLVEEKMKDLEAALSIA